jgi:chemotaxis protein CheC
MDSKPRDLIGIHVRIIGEVSGEMYFLFTRKDALRLVEMLVGERMRLTLSLNRIESSALSEIANILTGSYWYAMTDRKALNWRITVPTIVEDVGKILTLSNRVYDFTSMVFLTDITVPQNNVRGHFLLLPRQEALTKLLTNLE